MCKTHLAFCDYSEQFYSSGGLQKALLTHIFCLCCKYPKYLENTLIAYYSIFHYLSVTQIYFIYYLNSEKKMNIKELQNIFVISCLKWCIHDLIWKDNALLLITELLSNVIQWLLKRWNFLLKRCIAKALARIKSIFYYEFKLTASQYHTFLPFNVR